MTRLFSLVVVGAVFSFVGSASVLAQVDEDYNISLSDAVGSPGEIVSVTVIMDFSEGDSIQGWQWSICHDDEVLILDETNQVWDGDALDELNFTFTNVTIVDGEGWFGGYLLDVITYEVLDPGDGYEMAGMDYEIDANAELGFTDLTWCVLGVPEVNNRVVVDGVNLEPAQWDGSVEVVAPVEFLRGDADDSGAVFPLLDAIVILEFGFLGGDQPVCMDAADVDDSGVVEAILDALALLQYAFTDGEEPADPGPDSCGTDPSADDLVCEEANCA